MSQVAPAVFKVPESVLVVIHSGALEILLLERADRADSWQSVTGSRATTEESLVDTCLREVAEETGIRVGTADVPLERLTDWHASHDFEIYPVWRHRYAPGVTRNTEHVFDLEVPRDIAIRLDPREHLRHEWLGWAAAAARCFSTTNAEAIRALARRVAPVARRLP